MIGTGVGAGVAAGVSIGAGWLCSGRHAAVRSAETSAAATRMCFMTAQCAPERIRVGRYELLRQRRTPSRAKRDHPHELREPRVVARSERLFLHTKHHAVLF